MKKAVIRLWADHTGKEEVLGEVTEKLGLPRESEFKDILDALLTAIHDSSQQLMDIINA